MTPKGESAHHAYPLYAPLGLQSVGINDIIPEIVLWWISSCYLRRLITRKHFQYEGIF